MVGGDGGAGSRQAGTATLFALACAALLGVSGWHAWTGREAQLRETMTETANLAASFAQHAQDTVEMADGVLADIVRRAEEDGAPDEGQRARISRYMAERAAASSRVRHVALVDADGTWIASSLPALPPGGAASSADREFFAWHRDHPDRSPRVGAAVRSRAAGLWTIPVTRRIDRADGSFGGIAIAAIDAEVFHSLYRRVDMGPHGAVALVHGGTGTILVHEPAGSAVTGIDISGTAAWREHISQRRTDSFEYLPAPDSPVRLGSIRHADRYPLVVIAARAKGEALAAWWAEAVPQVLAASTLVLLTGFLGWRLIRQAARRRRLEEDAARAASGYQLLADNATDLIIRLDAGLRRTYVSPACRRVMGVAPETLLGGTPDAVVHPEDRAGVAAAFAKARGTTAGAAVCYRARHGSGAWIWLEASIRRVTARNSGGGPGGDTHGRGQRSAAAAAAAEDDGYVVVIRDVSGRKAAELELAEANQRLEALALQDGLTGLANRHHLDQVLDREYRRAARNGTPLALMMLDVDRFKAFNDLYGHQGGDEALRRIARALTATMRRPADLAARYGGEELAVLLPETDLQGAAELAERVRAAVRGLRLTHEGSEFGIATVSIGVAAILPHPGSDDMSAALVGRADEALYAAKRAGRDRVCAAAWTDVDSDPGIPAAA